MDRLTRRNPDGSADFANCDFEAICYDLSVSECATVRAALEKLAQYEDAEKSGQRMCHIDALDTRAYEVFKRDQRSFLCDLLCQHTPGASCSGGSYGRKEVSPCAYYMDCGDEEGHCMKPDKWDSKYRIRSIFVNGNDILNIGKTVFLTKEEAEAALKEREAKQ